jgi:hypothetical protein
MDNVKTYELSVHTEHHLWTDAPVKAVVSLSAGHLKLISEALEIIEKSGLRYNGLTLVWFGVSFRSYLHRYNMSFETADIHRKELFIGGGNV